MQQRCRLQAPPVAAADAYGKTQDRRVFKFRCTMSLLVAAAAAAAAPPSSTFHLVVFTSQQRRPRKKLAFIAPSFACAECGANDTTVQRKGPSGPKTLCNRCGLRWVRKEQRRREDYQMTIRRKVRHVFFLEFLCNNLFQMAISALLNVSCSFPTLVQQQNPEEVQWRAA